MKAEQKLTLAFALLGTIVGKVSESLGSLSLALIVPAVVYGISVLVASRFTNKKLKHLVGQTALVFALFWFMVWILFFNLR